MTATQIASETTSSAETGSHSHDQWNRVDELERNKAAIREHLAYVDALFSRDPDKIEATCRDHLASARKTLLHSIA